MSVGLPSGIDPKDLFGWAGPDQAKDAWQKIGHLFSPFKIIGSAEVPEQEFSELKRTVSWDFEKKLLGDFLPNIAQQIGDCVSWGQKNVTDRIALVEIVLLGESEEFHASFAPYFYGISRVQIGGGQLGNGDGSLGSWAAEGVRKYGVLAADTANCPKYSGSVAREWGRKGPPANFIEVAKPHPIKTTARIRSGEELAKALCNGYWCTIASNRGFAMSLKDRDGKSWYTGRDNWAHQMAFIGYDTVPEPCVFNMNSWGPSAHGPQLDGPPGGGWRTLEEVDKLLRDDGVECFANSGFDGFPARKLNYSMF